MRLLHLEYFKLLAENGHLRKTADIIHISPPALSTTISKLEDELQVTLFDHIGRNIQLNENGKILYTHVCTIFSELDTIKRTFSSALDTAPKAINVATSAATLWNEGISAFTKENPDITIRHSVLRAAQFQAPSALYVYDLIITHIGDMTDKTWEHMFIFEDHPVLLVYDGHPFTKKGSIYLEEARDESFVALSHIYSSSVFFEESCKQAGFVPKVVAEADYALRTQLVENQYGITLSSVLGAYAARTTEMKMIKLKDPRTRRIQTIFWKRNCPLLPMATQLRDFLVDFYKDI